MLLSPIKALFSKSFYQSALGSWGAGRSVLFLLYLTFLYVVIFAVVCVVLAIRAPEYLGELNEKHVVSRFLAQAPMEWKVTAEGLSLYDEAGQEIKQWKFEKLISVDTSQAGTYSTPESFVFMVSRTVAWSPEDSEGRRILFEEQHKKAGGDVRARVVRTVIGKLERIELYGPQGLAKTVTPEGIARAYGLLKVLVFVILLVVWFFVALLWKLGAAFTLSLVGLILNAVFRRKLSYGRIFLASLLVQSWVFTLNTLELAVGVLFPFSLPPFTDWLITAGFLIFIFYKFIPPVQEVPAGPAS